MRRFLLLIAVIASCMCLCAVAADITQTVRQRLLVDLPQNRTMQFIEVPAGYFLMGSPHSEVGGKRDKQPLHRVEIIASQNPETSQLSTKTLRTLTDDRYGFHLRYPDDWTVKEAITETTVFKAVKKFADGQYLMCTVNVQLLDRSDYTIDDISGFIRNVYGGDNVTVLDSGRAHVGDVSCIRLLLDTRRPLIQPRIEYSTNVIRNRYLYTVTVSCDKPLYQQHAQQIEQLGDSFTFTASPSAGSSVSTRGQTYGMANYRFVDEELQQKRKDMSFLRALGKVFLLVLATSAIVGIGKCILAKSKGKP